MRGVWSVPLVVAALAMSAVPAMAQAAASTAAHSDGTIYTPQTPVVDTVTGGPWTLSQGDPLAGPSVPQSNLLPTYTPQAGTSVTNPPNLSVYPAASPSSGTTPPFSPYGSGVAGTPGDLPAYCTSGGAFPETGQLNSQPNGATDPMSPYYFPYVMRTPGSASTKDLTGFFDYRPKDAEEETVSATSTDGGQSWAYTGRALSENPESYCPAGDTNDDGLGHPYVMSAGSSSRLYMLQRPAGDYPGVGMMTYPVAPSAANPLSGVPATQSAGVNPNTFATATVSVPATGGVSIPVTTLGTAGTAEQIFGVGAFTDPATSGSDTITCTGSNTTPALTGCTATSAETVSSNDDLLQVIGTVNSSAGGMTVPPGPNSSSKGPGGGGLSSFNLSPTTSDEATMGTQFAADIPGRFYVNGVPVYCTGQSVTGSNNYQMSNCTTPQSGGLTLQKSMPVTSDPIVPSGAQQTTGLLAPDGIVGTFPQSYNSTIQNALNGGIDSSSQVSIPSGATVVLYGEKILNYYIVGTTTATQTMPSSGTVSIQITTSTTPNVGVGTPSASHPVSIDVGYCPNGSTSTCPGASGDGISQLSCTGYTTSSNTLTGCTGYVPGTVIISGYTVGGPGAAIAPQAPLNSIGEGSTSPKTLFKNNEDFTALRYAYTTDGVNFTDLGQLSGSNSQSASNPNGNYTDVTNPVAQNYPASMDLATGAADDPELRWAGTRGTIVQNPDGSLTMFDSGAWDSDGDSDAFNQIFETTSADGVNWSVPTVVVSTDYTFSARQQQDAALASGQDVPLGVSAYYAGRAYGPAVVQNTDGSLTMVFSGYGAPSPTSKVGTTLGNSDNGTTPWTISAADPALYRNIMTVTLPAATSPPVATTTTLTSSDSTPVVGEQVTYTATVAPVSTGQGTPTGNVIFHGNAGTLCTATLNEASADQATCQTSYSGRGSDSVTASYAGDSNYASSAAGPTSETIAADNTSTTLQVSDPTPVTGEQVTFTATVAPTGQGAGTPTGTVTFSDPNGPLCAGASLNGGSPDDQATCVAAYPASGSDAVTATYSGDNNDNESNSQPPTSVTIGPAATTTGISSSDPSPVVGETVTYAATVTASTPGAGNPTGSVTFTSASTGQLCIANLDQADPDVATCQTSYGAPGTDSVTAQYASDGNYSSSSSGAASEAISKAATTTAISSDPASPVVGQQVTYEATVSPSAPGSGTATGTVAFSGNSGTICSGTLDQGSPADVASCTTTYKSSQKDAVSAYYGGDGDFTESQSQVLTVQVTPAPTTTGLQADVTNPVVGQTVTFTATVATTGPGSTTPTGTVTFNGGAGVLCTSTLSASSPYVATCQTSYPATGTDSVSATYNGDSDDLMSTSDGQDISISSADTTTSLASSDTTPVIGETVTYTATVAASAPGAGVPAGTVTFTGDDGNLCVVSLNNESPGQASCQVSYAATGNDSVTASYSPDANFNASQSGATSETISKAATTATLAASVSSTTTGQQITFTADVDTVAPGSGVPAGTVTFADGSGTTLCESTLGDATPDLATCEVSFATGGSREVTATYQGSGDYAGSTSNSVRVSVAAPSVTSVSVAPKPSVTGQEVAITATVTPRPHGTGTPDGTVLFSVENASSQALTCTGNDDAKKLADGKATCDIAAKDVSALTGPLSILAAYQGGATFEPSSGSTSAAVNRAGTTVTLATSRQPVGMHESVVYTATVAAAAPGSGKPTGTVTFSFSPSASIVCQGGDTVTLSGHTARCDVAAGMIRKQVQVTGTYSGSGDYQGASGSLTQTVG